MKLEDIRKNVVTTFHYTTIGGEELVFDNGMDCYKARENDIREWHSKRYYKQHTELLYNRIQNRGSERGYVYLCQR